MRLRIQDLLHNEHTKVEMLSALLTGRSSTRESSGTHLSYKLSRHHGHNASGRNTSMTNSNNPNGNQTRDLPASTKCATAHPEPV
jgi:hypothetical protein